jgi:hypothetical protein
MASPFSLKKEAKAKAGSGDYNTLLKKNMARYKDRDEAVKKTNIASGYGNSTAQRFMHGGGAKPGSRAAPAKDKTPTASIRKKVSRPRPGDKTVPIPADRPTRSPTSESNSLTPPPGIGSGIPTPPMPSFSPDLAVSPPHPPDPMSAGAPQGMGMSGTGYVPPMPSFSPDLAVSPPHPPDPMAGSAPTEGTHIGFNRPPKDMFGGPLPPQPPQPANMPNMGGAADPSWIKRLLGLGG